jgi:hypothetical protein
MTTDVRIISDQASATVGTAESNSPSGALSAMDVPGFLRLFQLRAPQIMWFLGAGASRAAGIKTASDMIWDFKQQLYRSQRKLPPSAITDIGDPIVQRRLQAHFDAVGTFPPVGSATEYSAYFEATYHLARDRRAYLDELITRGKPSFGHFALVLLMAEQLCRIVWTTNFDRLIEDAAARVLGSTGRLLVADLAEPSKLSQASDGGRWPIYGKLHGDYHSEHIKNIEAELRVQDAEMRRCFVEACRRQGLAAVGYSGRDASIMEALDAGLDGGRGFPAGLFWFKRSEDQPFAAVVSLIEKARGLGIDAHLIDAESFDELLSDVVRFLPQTADKIQSLTSATRPRLVKTTAPVSARDTPAIRTNALPVVAHPPICRLVECKIGGWVEIREAIAAAKVDIEAQRCSSGVVAFGRDDDIRRAFEPFGITAFETHPISPRKLAVESGERALLRDALFRAIGLRAGLRLERRNRTNLLRVDPAVVTAAAFINDQVGPVDRITGPVPGTAITWAEACALRLDYRFDRLWLLLDPRVVLDIPEGAASDHVDSARELVRRRRTGRHNRAANAMLDGWIQLIAGSEQRLRVRAFDIGNGINAEFELMRISGFSGVAR